MEAFTFMKPDVVVAHVLDRVAKNPVRYALVLIVASILLGGTVYSFAERDVSMPDGWWWAFVSMSTVGYGDITPKTTEIRFLAMFVIATGIAATAILTAALAGRIAERRIAHSGDLHDEFDDLIHLAISLKDRYAADEANDDAVLAAARASFSAWNVGAETDLEIAMYRLQRTLEANQGEPS